jgi:iron(III)-enterobactin esterase
LASLACSAPNNESPNQGNLQAGDAGSQSGASPAGAASAGTSGMTPPSLGGAGAAGTPSGNLPAAGSLSMGGVSSGGVGGLAQAGGVGGSGALAEPGTEGDGDFQITKYPADPALTPGKSPAGKRFSFNHSGSKLYPATASRAITVYVPAKYQDGTPAPVMVVMDGAGSQFLRVQAALDNLSQSTDPTRRVPAFILVAVANGQRSIELDTMSDLWARYIDEEVFAAVVSNPAIKAAYPNIAITKDPEGRGAVGCSSGGSAAIVMSWFRPDLFRRVIGYDASLVNLQSSPMYPLGAWDLHSDLELIQNSPVKPIRIMFNDNEMDNGAGTGEAGAKDWLLAGQRTAAALKGKGYHYRWLEGMGAKHCSDARVQETSMGDSLVWVWRGYPAGP